MSGKRGMVTMIAVDKVYQELEQATITADSADNLKADLKEFLDRKIGDALLSGEINGKNEEIRMAQARQLFPGLFDELDNATLKAREADLALTLAKLGQSRIKDLLRAKELILAVL